MSAMRVLLLLLHEVLVTMLSDIHWCISLTGCGSRFAIRKLDPCIIGD